MKKTLTLLLLLAGVTMEARAEDLIWNGSEGQMTWNTTDKNWLQGGASVVYTNDRSVVFRDTGSGEVTLAGELKPASVLVEAENEYTFSGTGKLSGDMTLTKSGCGTLTIYTANGYTGGTVIKEGTIVMGNDKALGTGNVTLGAKFLKASLDLDEYTLSANVTVAEDTWWVQPVQMGNGALNGDISLGYYGALTLSGYLSGTGGVTMGKCSWLDLNGNTLFRDVILDWDASQGTGYATIGNGTLNGNITVGANQDLTVLGELSGTGAISLGDSSKVFLSGNTLSKDVNVNGNASITLGTIKGKVTVAAGKCLSISGTIDMAGAIDLDGGSTLDLGNQTMTLQGASSITFSGSSAGIGNGTLNGSFSVGAGKTLSLCGNLTGTGSIVMGADSTLALDKHALSKSVDVTENAVIKGGEISGSVTVAAGKCLSLKDDYSITGSITLNEGSKLNLGGAETGLDKLTFTGQSAMVDNGTLLMESGNTVTLAANLSGSAIIFLESDSKLDLGKHTLSTNVTVAEDTVWGDPVQIGNGTLNGNISLGYYSALTLCGDLAVTGDVTMGKCSTLDLNGATLYGDVTLNWDTSQGNGFAAIGNGTLNGNITVGDHQDLDVFGELSGTGTITVGDSCAVATTLGTCIISKDVNLTGNASISSCTINGKVTVAADKCLSLHGPIGITNEVALGEGSTLDLGKQTMNLLDDSSITFSGNSASIGNGTLNGYFSVGAGKNLTLFDDLAGMGSIALGADSKLDLNGKILSKPVTLTENASIGNGTNNGSVTVSDKKALTLFDNLSGTGSIALGDKTILNLNGKTLSNSVILNGKASISQGTLNGDLAVGEDMVLTLLGNLDGSGTVSLGHKGVLALQGNTLSNNVSVEGIAFIDNGTITGDLTVAEGQKLYLVNFCSAKGDISLGDNAMLDLGDSTLSYSQIKLDGSASIGNGRVDTNLSVGSGKTLSLCGNLAGAGTISLSSDATLDLNNNTLANYVTVTDTASIGNGTIDGSVYVYASGGARFTGETRIDKGSITAGATTVKALKEDSPGLLQELSVTNGLISGTDRQASLADGLRIESSASLMIKSMTITANNEIYVGSNVITLNQVTIDLSQAEYKLVGSDYYFQLQALINCKLEMDDVVFDASELELPTGFDPLVNGIGMDFGDDVNIDLETAKNLTLLMKNYTSQTVSLDAQGRPVFKALVPIPEPATGTLSLLALCALAARRRRKH